MKKQISTSDLAWYCRFRVRAIFFEIRSGDRGTKKRENDSLCVIIWVGVAILSSKPCVRYHNFLDGR